MTAKTKTPPVTVDQHTRRSDEDAITGSWVDVVAGEHAGRRGALEVVFSHGDDGYPELVGVRSRDADNEVLHVKYKDVRPAPGYNGGR